MPTRRALILGAPALLAAAGEAVPLYAAMTLRRALDAVVAAYRAEGGAATPIYGPTPVLVAQLASGAPPGVLLTADAGWMDDAARRGLIAAATRRDLLRNDLVLAGAAGAASIGMIGPDFPLLQRLADGRLAMCDPERDPAGRFARQSLAALGFWEAVAGRIAVAESSLAAVTFVDRGEVALAACFTTDVLGDARATSVGRFPANSHAPIVYPVALSTGASPPAASLLAFLQGAKAGAIFTQFGYLPGP